MRVPIKIKMIILTKKKKKRIGVKRRKLGAKASCFSK